MYISGEADVVDTPIFKPMDPGEPVHQSKRLCWDHKVWHTERYINTLLLLRFLSQFGKLHPQKMPQILDDCSKFYVLHVLQKVEVRIKKLMFKIPNLELRRTLQCDSVLQVNLLA